MPIRPYLLLRPIARPIQPCICRARLGPRPSPRIQVSSFHSTVPRFSDSTTDHYETLQLTSNASPADVKRQFYNLSKKHHPDRNPDDPTASTRFVAISEAYHVLSVPEKRTQYDAQLQSAQPRSPRWAREAGNYPQGSYSSASFGSRPASGLNKKKKHVSWSAAKFLQGWGLWAAGCEKIRVCATRSEYREAGGSRELWGLGRLWSGTTEAGE